MEQKRVFQHWVNYAALALFLVSGILLWIAPIYFAPPYFEQTGYVYLALLCLWLPFLLIFGRWQGKRYACAHPALLMLGMMMSCFWFMVLAPALVLPEPLRSFPMECDKEALADDQVRYTCIQESSDANSVYILEGRDGFPLVWLKERDLAQRRAPLSPTTTPTSAP